MKMENNYEMHVNVIRDNIKYKEDKDELKSFLDTIHESCEEIPPITESYKMYIVHRVVDGSQEMW